MTAVWVIAGCVVGGRESPLVTSRPSVRRKFACEVHAYAARIGSDGLGAGGLASGFVIK